MLLEMTNTALFSGLELNLKTLNHKYCIPMENDNKIYQNGFEILPIIPEHLIRLSTLGYFHRGPIDRIIISQGLSEDIAIVTSEDKFDKYKVNRKWG
jgi:PIN domain nuclease of toxin-antitoxin system